MIKAWTFHKGFFHLLILVGDAIQHHECPASWFQQKKVGDKVEVNLVWPPPNKPKPQVAGLVDRAMAEESLVVTKEL